MKYFLLILIVFVHSCSQNSNTQKKKILKLQNLHTKIQQI